jgi:pimeloyl-ACP methyl ester carboxylesterase/DNA-binding SARP family transcriptional activator
VDHLIRGSVPETRFALTPSGSSIAYQCIGDSDLTIVSVPPMAQNIEMAWEWPAIRQMFEGFATFCRFVPFDKRGTGMSNRSLDMPRFDERIDELSAVLDDADIDRAFVMGTSEGGPMALMFAATYPDRVQGVILESTSAYLRPHVDEVHGLETDESPSWRDRFVAGWGTSESITVDEFAPSLANDDEFRRWHQHYERNAASRDAIGTLMDLGGEMDARGVLHRIECPVLILHRVGDRIVPIDAARETYALLQSHGVDVGLVEMPGDDHFLYATNLEFALATIERFTTGEVSDRRLTWKRYRTEIATMGHFDVVVDDTTIPTSAWGSKRARTLLKRLVVARGRSVTRDELIEVLWPDASEVDDRLGARLSVQLSAVRRILRGGVIADRSSIRLDLHRIDVDIERWFAQTHDAAIVADHAGEFLPDDRYEDWSMPLRDEIRARFSAAAHRLAEVSTSTDAIELWRRVLIQDPYDELAHRSLITALRHEGRIGDARSAYQTYVAAMDDLAVPPTSWDDIGR